MVVRAILVIAMSLAVVACGDSGGGLSDEDIERIYLAWELEDYGPLASETITSVGVIATDGDCTAAEVVDESGYDSTLFVRGEDEVAAVLTGHVVDYVDGDSEKCFSRP